MRAIARSALSLALVLLATAVHAGAGVNLRWDRCLGDAGTQNKTFACDTNTGSDVLVCSFELDTEVLQASGQEVTIELVASAAALPAWWSFKNAGTCRQLSLSMNTVISPSAVVCSDWSDGQSVGGIGAYITPSFFGPGSARIVIASAVPLESLAHLFPGTEYFVCNLLINHAKTIGTGACSGCAVPMCIVFRGDHVTTPVAADGVFLSRGANGSFFVTWQGPTGPAPFGCPYPVPTLRSSWGAVKSLYR